MIVYDELNAIMLYVISKFILKFIPKY